MTAPNADLPIDRWPEWPLIEGECGLLKTIDEAAGRSPSTGVLALCPLIDSVSGSTETLQLLVRRFAIRDAYVIARVVYETAVNACFIATDPASLADRALRHAKQKALRDLERSIELAGEEMIRVRWSGADAALSHPPNKLLLQEFTGRSGREITSWTPENVRERLEVIYGHFGRDLTMGLVYGLLLYRHASEIAHGTLYGALFSWGAMDPNGLPKSPAAIQSFRVDQSRLILMLSGFALESLVRITASVLGIEDVAVSAARIKRSFSKRPRPDT